MCPGRGRPHRPDADAGSSAARRREEGQAERGVTETARLLKQRRDVLRWGVDMLPEPKPAAGGGRRPT